MYEYIIGLVKDPQFVIDVCDYALCFGEFEDFSSHVFDVCMEDVLNFHLDMLLGRGQ